MTFLNKSIPKTCLHLRSPRFLKLGNGTAEAQCGAEYLVANSLNPGDRYHSWQEACDTVVIPF